MDGHIHCNIVFGLLSGGFHGDSMFTNEIVEDLCTFPGAIHCDSVSTLW